jgi:peroxiredoxin
MKALVLFLFVSASAMATTVTSFTLPWMNSNPTGGTYKSTDHPNGIFVVEAYFLNCPYCNDNAANVDALADQYAGNPRVQFLDVGIDTADSSYTEWINRHHPTYPVLKDAKRTLIGQLGTEGYPSTYVIDCKGNVVAQTEGEWGGEETQTIKNGIDQLVGQECHAN